MSESKVFQSALSNFIFEFACGGAVRHLVRQGYTSRQITERLSYPVSYERVREAATDYMLEEGILLRREPAQGGVQEKYVYVQEHGEYGRTSFRRVPVKEEGQGAEGGRGGAEWGERVVTEGVLLERLKRHASRTDGGRAYISCDFGRTGMEFEGFALLNDRQQEYLEGIRWDRQRMYHLLIGRMLEIAIRLCEGRSLNGKIYFEAEREILVPETPSEVFMKT